MAKNIIKAADIKFGETIYIPFSGIEMREAKLVRLNYDSVSLNYEFVVAGLEDEMIIHEPQLCGYKPNKFYRTSGDAFKGITIPLTTINLADKLFEAGFSFDVDSSKIIMTTYEDFNLSPKYIHISDAIFSETCDKIDVNLRQYKQVTMKGITCYQYEDSDIIIFMSDEDAQKAQPIRIYKF